MLSNRETKQKRIFVPGRLNRTHLTKSELTILDDYADESGFVQDRDIYLLLKRVSWLRLLLGELVANAGCPVKDREGIDRALVRTTDLEKASAEAVFSRESRRRWNDPEE